MNTQQARRERMLSVRETAQVLGLCLDSVRRHLRSGKMPGVRVGRNWRIPESQLSAYMGLIDEMPSHSLDDFAFAEPSPRPSFHEQAYTSVRTKAPRRAKPAPQAPPASLDLADSNNDVVEALFRTHPARARILNLVKEAASGADFSPEEAQHLLNELNELLHQL